MGDEYLRVNSGEDMANLVSSVVSGNNYPTEEENVSPDYEYRSNPSDGELDLNGEAVAVQYTDDFPDSEPLR